MDDDNSKLFSSPTLSGRRKFYVMAMHLVLLTSVCLLLTWPVLIHGIPDLSHDGYHHARWAAQFSTQFWRGDLFPRWFSNANGGFGGPSGFFSPPLPNYVSSLFWPYLAKRDPEGWLAAGYPIVVGLILSAVTAYFWLLSFGSAGGALLGSMVYITAPYHLAIDVYMRGASTEFWVFVWFPLVLLSAHLLIRHSKWGIPGVAVSFALAVLSHPTTSLCFAPIPVSFVFFFSEKRERIKNTALITAALLVGIGLSAVYLLPAVLDQSKAHADWYQTGYFDYHNEWLVQNGKELWEMMQFASGAHISNVAGIGLFPLRTRMLEVTILTLLVAIALFTVVRRCNTERRTRSLALFWIITAFTFFFLMNRFSSFVWSLAVFLKFLQFPFRLNIMLIVCAAALVPLAYRHLGQPSARLLTACLCLMLMASLAADIYSSRFNFSITGIGNMSRLGTIKPLIRDHLDAPEMWPKPGNVQALSNASAFDWFSATHPPQTARLQASHRISSGTASVEDWQPRRVVLNIDALRPTVLTVDHFYYSGWLAHLAGTNGQVTAYPSEDGLVQVNVPQGRYQLVLELPRDNAERAGIVISILSLLLVGGSTAWAWRQRPDMALA